MHQQRKQTSYINMISYQTEFVVDNSQIQDLRNLFQFIQNVKNLPIDQLKRVKFSNGMELKELLSNLAQNLNKGSSQYDKKYVGYICNFLSIAKIEAFSNSILLLKQSFYLSLAPILFDILRFWQSNLLTDRYGVARAKLVAFLRILCQINKSDITILKKVFRNQVIELLIKFVPPNDQTILNLYKKLIFICLKIASEQQKIKLIQNVYCCLKNDRFPLGNMDEILKLIVSALPIQFLQLHDQKATIVKNLKQILKTNLSSEHQFVNLGSLSNFVSLLNTKNQPIPFTLIELFELCQLTKGVKISKNKLLCLKLIEQKIKVYSQQQQRSIVSKFLHDCNMQNISLVFILPKIISKLSSQCLISLIQQQFLQKVTKILVNNEENIRNRISMFRVFKQFTLRLQSINKIVFQIFYQRLVQFSHLFQTVEGPVAEQLLGFEFKFQFLNFQ